MALIFAFICLYQHHQCQHSDGYSVHHRHQRCFFDSRKWRLTRSIACICSSFLTGSTDRAYSLAYIKRQGLVLHDACPTIAKREHLSASINVHPADEIEISTFSLEAKALMWR